MHPSSRDRTVGGLFVVAGLLFQGLWLGRAAALLTVALTLVIFLLHACEEFLTGFQRRIPALVGDRWTDTQFLVFNPSCSLRWAGASAMALLRQLFTIPRTA
jgi:hypothetical protein